MPYFQRTITFDWKAGLYFKQKTPECYGYCADWLRSTVGSGNVFTWFSSFSKTGTVTKFDKTVRICAELTPEAQSRITSLYQSYRSNPTGGSVWGQILRGTAYQVEASVPVPITETFSGDLSRTIADYAVGMIGWSYSTDSDVSFRNHQTAVFCTSDNVHFFDPNIGLYIVDRDKFPLFFKKYYKDVVENEKSALEILRKSGFYKTIDIRGVSLIFT